MTPGTGTSGNTGTGAGTDTSTGGCRGAAQAARALARKSVSARARASVTALAGIAAFGACGGRDAGPPVSSTARGSVERDSARVVVNEVMANPRAVPDERGEWLEVYNWGTGAANLRGWTIASGGDAPHRVGADVRVAPGGYAVLA